MAVLTRIVAAAALVSIALAPVASASAAEVYGVAAQRARAHHERAANVNAHTGGERRKRAVAKRCAAPSSSLHTTKTTSSEHETSTSVHTTEVHTTTTHKVVVKPSTTSHAAATTKAVSTGGGGGGGSGKKGLAWSGSNQQLDAFTSVPIKFIYNWGATPPKKSGILSCSMLWGEKNLDAFRSARNDYDCLMGPNEFNLGSQSGLSVQQVYQLWKDEILPHGGGKTLISPSVTTANTGLPDMQQLIKLCGGDCGWTAVSVHYYGNSADDLIKWVTDFRTGLGYPDIWITEWSCQPFNGDPDCTSDQAWAMLQGTVKWAEATSWVKAYAPYGFAEDLGNVNPLNALMTGSGKPSAMGSWYLNN